MIGERACKRVEQGEVRLKRRRVEEGKKNTITTNWENVRLLLTTVWVASTDGATYVTSLNTGY